MLHKFNYFTIKMKYEMDQSHDIVKNMNVEFRDKISHSILELNQLIHTIHLDFEANYGNQKKDM